MKKIKGKFISNGLIKFALPLLVILFVQLAVNAQTFRLSGTWTMFNDKNEKFDKQATITQTGANLSINNGYGANSTAVLNGNTFTTSDGLKGTVSADGMRIHWNIGYVWVKQVVNNLPNKIEGETPLTPADSGMITRTITVKNNSGMQIEGMIYQLNSSETSKHRANTNAGGKGWMKLGDTRIIGSNVQIPSNDLAELRITMNSGTEGGEVVEIFKAILPRNKDYTTFCYEVSGTYFVPIIKTCDGSPTFESKHISFKNEAGYNSTMSLTYYPLSSSTAKTVDTVVTTPGYQTKLYLPLDANTDKPMTLKVTGGDQTLKEEKITLNSFDTTCYKVWGSIFSKKINPCSANTSARTIKLKNNGAYQARMEVTYDDGGTPKKVRSNPIEVLESDTVEVPLTAAKTPIKIRFLAYGKEFAPTIVSSDFTGELCYKLEGTAIAPNASTCDDTVGDTTGETRQIRFQNDAGYDAQMLVTYFVDEVINGNKIPMAKLLSTGMINGLGGKFRLVTIPKNTSKGMPITISLQGNATVKNDMFSTTLPDNFAASPQPCFKVTGTLFDPSGGKCNQ